MLQFQQNKTNFDVDYFCHYETLKAWMLMTMAYDNEDVDKRQQNTKVEERKEEAIRAQIPGPRTAVALGKRQMTKRPNT